MAVAAVSPSMAHSTGISTKLKASPAPSTMKRSARSMSPPLASRPSDSALARWYDTNKETAMSATGSMKIRPGSVVPRYQAAPANRRASHTRSLTESKKAPRTELVPDALAMGPSRASENPVRIKNTSPRISSPRPITTAATAAMAMPNAVTASALMPIRHKTAPMGSSPRLTAERQLPSNMWLLLYCSPDSQVSPVFWIRLH